MDQPVDPRFVRHFGLQIWKRAQEKAYFEERKKYREWWWNHTVVPAWACLTWTHAGILLAGTWSFAKALFWIRINWFLLSVVAQSTCALGLTTELQCNFTQHSTLFEGACPTNLTAPFTHTYLKTWLYDPTYWYTWVPESLETAVVIPFVLWARFYRRITLPLVQWWWGFGMMGVFCVK